MSNFSAYVLGGIALAVILVLCVCLKLTGGLSQVKAMAKKAKSAADQAKDLANSAQKGIDQGQALLQDPSLSNAEGVLN